MDFDDATPDLDGARVVVGNEKGGAGKSAAARQRRCWRPRAEIAAFVTALALPRAAPGVTHAEARRRPDERGSEAHQAAAR